MAKKELKTLENISKETQLVRNDKGDMVEVKAGGTFQTYKWKELLRNYKHLFKITDEKKTVEKEEEVVEDIEKKATKKAKK